MVAASVIAARLETLAVPGEDGRSDDELFPEREVRTVAGEPVVVAELVPAPDVPPSFLFALFQRRQLNLLYWSP